MGNSSVLDDPLQEAVRKKYFPHVPWTEQGPVRRQYRARASQGGDVLRALEALAREEGFIATGETAVFCDGRQSFSAFQAKGDRDTLVFGTGPEALWCDLAAGPPGEGGWQKLLVRSEEAENLVALAHAVGAVRFQKI